MFIFILLFQVLCSSNTNPGVEAVIPLSTFNSLSKEIVPYFAKQFSHMTIPEIDTEMHTPIGKVEFKLKGMQTKSLQLSNPTFKVASTSTLQMFIGSVYSSMHGDWEYKEKHGIKAHDHGSLDITLGATLDIVFGAKLSTSHASGVQVLITSLNLKFTKFDLKLHGGQSWLYNLVLSQLKDTIEKSIEKAASQQVSSLVVPVIQKKLDAFANYPLPFEGLIASMVVERFDFTNNELVAGCKGEILKKGVTPYPGPAPALPSVVSSKKMITAYVSSYLPNSAMYVLNKIGVLKYVITQKTIPPKIPIKLNTSFFEIFLPQLYKAYPNKAMQITIQSNADKSPDVTFSPGVALVTGHLDTIFQVLDPDVIDAFTIDTYLALAANVSFFSNGTMNLISAQVTLKDFNMTLSQSSIGKLDITLLKVALGTILKDFGFPLINQYLKDNPIAFPPIPDVKIKSPELKFNDGYMGFDADIDIHLS